VNAAQGATKREKLACLIIDDPLLKPRYGCLEYAKLLREMKEHGFFTEIAFIPWNYRRSDPKTVRLFAENSSHFAICPHGCNHLRDEFGHGSYQELRALSSTALWRMEEHKRRTGLPFDPVFVFPQGRFSSLAMQALKDQGFFAAFNSTLRATDGEEPPASERERAATPFYSGLPLFLRRYPRDRHHIAMDMASDRPILIVEHHGAFRSGYQSITDLVDWINSFGGVRWTSLLEIAEHYLGTKGAPVRGSPDSSPSSLRFRARVAVRRLLSEARDNHVQTNGLLAKAYDIVRGVERREHLGGLVHGLTRNSTHEWGEGER
jgi:hypothetical protein